MNIRDPVLTGTNGSGRFRGLARPVGLEGGNGWVDSMINTTDLIPR